MSSRYCLAVGNAAKPVRNLIEVSYASAPELIEIHRGHSVNHPHPKHWHEEFHICAITAGSGYLEHRGVSHFTGVGSFRLVPPGEVHANRASNEDGCSYENIYVRPEMMARLVGEASFPPVENEPRVHAEFLRLIDALICGSGLHRETAMIEFFRGLAQTSSCGRMPEWQGCVEPRAVGLVREYLDENYDREVGLAELAAITEMSPFHLNRVFRKQLGLPPHAYQVQLRIARAKALLRQKFPIAEVASRTGFADQSHLNRHFKRIVGITPGQFAGSPERKRKNIQYQSAAAD